MIFILHPGVHDATNNTICVAFNQVLPALPDQVLVLLHVGVDLLRRHALKRVVGVLHRGLLLHIPLNLLSGAAVLVHLHNVQQSMNGKRVVDEW